MRGSSDNKEEGQGDRGGESGCRLGRLGKVAEKVQRMQKKTGGGGERK